MSIGTWIKPRLQDFVMRQMNPIWNRISDGCNINRQIDRVVEDSGFELTQIDRFRGKGPGLFAHMFRGVATSRA